MSLLPPEQCRGVRDINDAQCTNQAKYRVIGLIANYGIPNRIPLCEKCLEIAKEHYPNGYPMMMGYNEFPLSWKPINTLHPFKTIDGKIAFVR